MQLPRMIVTDLDGTLLPESKVLPQRTIDVLMSLREQGVVIALATGKFYHLTRRYADQLGDSTPVVALDGARIHTGNGGNFSEGIDRNVVEALLGQYDAPHLSMFADSGNDEMLLRAPDAEIPPAISAWASDIRRVEDARAHLTGDPALLSFYGPDRVEVDTIAHTVKNDYPGLRAGVFPTTAYGEARVVFQQRGITKGTGVKKLCDILAISPDECMVFGDWHNDRPMFKQGFVNVAMRNAVPELLENAHHVTSFDNEHEGVADFLASHFLN